MPQLSSIGNISNHFIGSFKYIFIKNRINSFPLSQLFMPPLSQTQ